MYSARDVDSFAQVVTGTFIMIDLHMFMVSVSRIGVDPDGTGGTAPDAMMWDKGGILKPCSSSLRTTADHACFSARSTRLFKTALGEACHRISLRWRMSLSGPTVSFSSSLPSWPLLTGLKVLLIRVNFASRVTHHV